MSFMPKCRPFSREYFRHLATYAPETLTLHAKNKRVSNAKRIHAIDALAYTEPSDAVRKTLLELTQEDSFAIRQAAEDVCKDYPDPALHEAIERRKAKAEEALRAPKQTTLNL